jgi:hypothetical protein
MAYGKSTSNLMDAPIKFTSIFTPYVGDNGYKFTGLNSIFVLDVANGTLVTYNEASVTPVGAVPLVAPNENELTVAYNQAMFAKIQHTQIQDIPVKSFAKKWAYQQISEVFIPAHDAYSLAKLSAARPVGNVVTTVPGNWQTTSNLSLEFEQAINLARTNGNLDTNMACAWMSYGFSAALAAQITFTGSDQGYKDAKSGYLGKHKGVKCIETKDDFFAAKVHVIVADKRAIIAVKPKMTPSDIRIIEKVPGFGGIEVQLRDRGDTFVLSKKAPAVATIENV